MPTAPRRSGRALSAAGMKRLLIAVLLAAALTAGLLALVELPSNGPTIFSLILLPFYMIGVLVSHNAHQPDEFACYASMFLFFFLVSLAGLAVWSSRHGSAK
jgi:hypothetical protein